MSEHHCNWASAWPIGHPLPVEDPAKLEGPEVGTFCWYQPADLVTYRDGVRDIEVRNPVLVRVVERSYVWSPGECRSHGGYRHYDWTVIEEGPDKYRSVVVNDEQLTPLDPNESRWVRTAYVLRNR